MSVSVPLFTTARIFFSLSCIIPLCHATMATKHSSIFHLTHVPLFNPHLIATLLTLPVHGYPPCLAYTLTLTLGCQHSCLAPQFPNLLTQFPLLPHKNILMPPAASRWTFLMQLLTLLSAIPVAFGMNCWGKGKGSVNSVCVNEESFYVYYRYILVFWEMYKKGGVELSFLGKSIWSYYTVFQKVSPFSFLMPQKISIFCSVFCWLCQKSFCRFSPLYSYIHLPHILHPRINMLNWEQILLNSWTIFMYGCNSTHHYHRGFFFCFILCIFTFLIYTEISFNISILFHFLCFMGIAVMVHSGEKSHTSYLNYASYLDGENLM